MKRIWSWLLLIFAVPINAELASGQVEVPALPVQANLFPAQTWQPPPPPPPPPPAPSAPPLPFQYGGQLQDGNELKVFLMQQQRQHIVRVGDLIDNIYRVKAIRPERIEFIYLPLKQKQDLLTGPPP